MTPVLTEKIMTELIRDGAALLLIVVLIYGPTMMLIRNIMKQHGDMIQGVMEKLDALVDTVQAGLKDTSAALSRENEKHRGEDGRRHLEMIEAIHAIQLHCAVARQRIETRSPSIVPPDTLVDDVRVLYGDKKSDEV